MYIYTVSVSYKDNYAVRPTLCIYHVIYRHTICFYIMLEENKKGMLGVYLNTECVQYVC